MNKFVIVFFNKDDVYVLEQQLFRKQRELTFAKDQLQQMTSLSQNVNNNKISFCETQAKRSVEQKSESTIFHKL